MSFEFIFVDKRLRIFCIHQLQITKKMIIFVKL